MATDIETQASELGWVPKESFRGDPEKWVDAQTFVKRGEEFIPMLKATTRRQADELAGLRGQLAETQKLLKASAEAIDALKEFNSDATRKEMKERKGELLDALAAAKREGDVEREVELTDQLTEHNVELKKAESTAKPNGGTAPATTVSQVQDYTKDPAFQAWTAENPWFGPDRRRTALAYGIANELRSDPANNGLLGKAFFDKISEEVEKTLPNPRREGPGKSAEGARTTGEGGGGGNGSRSYSDLPAEAKAACERLAPKLVGEGRGFTTLADWRKSYTTKFFEGE